MMIGPTSFRMEYAHANLTQLLQVKEELLLEMKEYEDKYIYKTKTLSTEEKMVLIDPSPDVVYSLQVSYLKEVLDLISIKLMGQDK